MNPTDPRDTLENLVHAIQGLKLFGGDGGEEAEEAALNALEQAVSFLESPQVETPNPLAAHLTAIIGSAIPLGDGISGRHSVSGRLLAEARTVLDSAKGGVQ